MEAEGGQLTGNGPSFLIRDPCEESCLNKPDARMQYNDRRRGKFGAEFLLTLVLFRKGREIL